jgi:hypothetical protein
MTTRPFQWMVVFFLLLAVAGWPSSGQATVPEKEEIEAAEDAAPEALQPGAEEIGQDWGIEITRVGLTAAGHMIDFRYKVLDAEKATPLFKRETKPYLTDQASGRTLAVPVTGKVGPLRNSNMPQDGRIYWMFFGNTGQWVKRGAKVTLQIGDFRVENLVVE